MSDVAKHYVVELPSRSSRRVEGSIAGCLAWIKGEPAGNGRFAIVPPDGPTNDPPPAVMCVPLEAMIDWEALAAAVVAEWEKTWLLIESMPSRHREEARADLHHAVATALISAAIAGVDEMGGPDVGF